MKKTGFIFDLDGVIVDTAKYHYLAWKNLADELGIQFTEDDNEKFKGVSRKRCLEILLEMGNISVSKEQFDLWLQEKNEDYLKYISKMDKSEILPDVPKVLEYLKEKGIPMALGSASKNAVSILKKVELMSYFDAIVDGTQVTKAKPDPEVFLIAAKKIGVKPKNCVVFEDALAGIEAADHGFNNFTEIDLGFLNDLILILKSKN